MPRRAFLLSLALSLAAVCGAVWWRGLTGAQLLAERALDVVWSPNRRLRYHYHYLDLDPASVDTYIREFEHYVSRLPRFGSWPDAVYSRFLLSTDFFWQGADEARRVRYVGFYEPYARACLNPFARFDSPA
jgi:hypothetical protein